MSAASILFWWTSQSRPMLWVKLTLKSSGIDVTRWCQIEAQNRMSIKPEFPHLCQGLCRRPEYQFFTESKPNQPDSSWTVKKSISINADKVDRFVNLTRSVDQAAVAVCSLLIWKVPYPSRLINIKT